MPSSSVTANTTNAAQFQKMGGLAGYLGVEALTAGS